MAAAPTGGDPTGCEFVQEWYLHVNLQQQELQYLEQSQNVVMSSNCGKSILAPHFCEAHLTGLAVSLALWYKLRYDTCDIDHCAASKPEPPTTGMCGD